MTTIKTGMSAFYLRPAEIKLRAANHEMSATLQRGSDGRWFAFVEMVGLEHLGRFVVCRARRERKPRGWADLRHAHDYLKATFGVTRVSVC